MPRLLTGHTLVGFNLLQGVKTWRYEGVYNCLILLGKSNFQDGFAGAEKPQTFV